MHRVFCTSIPESGEIAELEDREAEHLFKVFRARVGDEAELLDGRGTVARGLVESGRKLRVVRREKRPEPAEKIHLCCALPRKQKLDQLLKQAAELGAWSIRPVRCARSVAVGDPRERWDLLLREACKQSGNPFLPEILPEERLPEVLKNLQKENMHIYYGSVAPALPCRGAGNDRAAVIGPEGGFSPEEEDMLKRSGAEPLNLGPYVLRLETAAVCALAALRMLTAVMAAAAVVLMSGCSGDTGKNPLMMKGRTLMESGDFRGARDYFRRAIALYPDDPAPYLALAQVCDEELDEPLEAAFAYRIYMRLLPEGDPEKARTEALLNGICKRAASQLAGEALIPAEKYRQLEKEAAELRERTEKMEKVMIRQQVRVNELYAELRKLKSGKVK